MLGNNTSCKVTKISSIGLRMYDGKIRELSNMRHVSELERNLISLSMLNKVGCSIRVKSSMMKVIKESMVLMKSDMSNGLYILQGIALSSDVSVIENHIHDKILLLHPKLGHMSEMGIKEQEK